MFKSFGSVLLSPVSCLLVVIGFTFAFICYETHWLGGDGLGERYIGNSGMEIVGNGAVIIAKSGSTVVLYKNAQLTEGVFSRFLMQVDFAINFDDRFTMTYGGVSQWVPVVWDSRTIAKAGSLILAGGNARVLAEDGAKIIHKNVEAPDWLWQGLTAETYAAAQHEAD